MNRLRKVTKMSLLILFLSSCSSVLTIEKACPYGGTKLNTVLIREHFNPPPNQTEFGAAFVHGLWIPATIDFPLSLVVDTVLLPVQGTRYLLDEQKDELCRE